jgi:RNA polymerase sigma factor (sigma-70 family)
MAPEIPAAGGFADWVAPSLPAVHRYAARLVGASYADDLVQEALLRAWRRRDTYDPGRGEPLPWLLAIVHDRARRHRRSRRDQLPLESSDGISELLPADLDLERALARLSARQRQAVDLYYFLDLDVETTARAMDCAPGTVRATLHQARAALRDLLGEDGG